MQISSYCTLTLLCNVSANARQVDEQLGSYYTHGDSSMMIEVYIRIWNLGINYWLIYY